jgi:hypothetical protein
VAPDAATNVKEAWASFDAELCEANRPTEDTEAATTNIAARVAAT